MFLEDMITKLINKLDQTPEKRLLKISLFIALFILIAHGGSLLVDLNKKNGIEPELFFTVPIALFVFISSIIGLRRNDVSAKILSLQGIILLSISVYSLHFALTLLYSGFPAGRFSWSLGLFTFIVIFPVYLVRRFILLPKFPDVLFLKYFHVVLLIASLALEHCCPK